ncbi:unnamed protein product [Diabrotica balteata]|uniref:Uncharacterized protein n=1 Tax=Diabrotica balteata TaxID=107213 RepID=A0A9N9SVQ3_DIABA|nr:unnamed protein product [Diabrotica balteata]
MRKVYGPFLFLVFISLDYGRALEHDHHPHESAEAPSLEDETYDRILKHDPEDHLEHHHSQEHAELPSLKHETNGRALEYDPNVDLEEHHSQESVKPPSLNYETYGEALEPDLNDDEDYHHYQEPAEPKFPHYETTYDKFFSEQLPRLKELTSLQHHLPYEIDSNHLTDNKGYDNNENLIMHYDEFGPLWMIKLFDMDDDDRNLDNDCSMYYNTKLNNRCFIKPGAIFSEGK